jgi:shikimate kinase
VKETERVAALEIELKKMGIVTKSTGESLVIHGGKPRSARISTYSDHRMAMSFAIAGTVLPGMEILDPLVVDKTFPQFWHRLEELGVKTERITRNIILIGMRGSGKTTSSILLSEKIHMEYVDLDAVMVKKLGMSLNDIVEKHGWEFVRTEEAKIVSEMSELENKIIATGGGVVINSQNVNALKKKGILIYLRANTGILTGRIKDDLTRAPLTNKNTRLEEMEDIMKERRELYEEAADEIIDTDNLAPFEVADRILVKISGGKAWI